MASHSFGMHENPFTPGLTLSADETVRLLQSRVSASGGDGERVFPGEACLEVHRWAGGDPVAVWSLAAAAMQRAADAGSETVTVEHVRAAAGPTNENKPTASPDPAGSPGVGEYPAADPPAEPPVPTERLSHLDPSARAWVARFIGSPDARRPGTHTPTIQQIASTRRQGAGGAERTWALPDEGRPPRGLPRRRRRVARLLGAQAMAVATPLLIVAAILLYLYQRRDQLLPKPETGSAAVPAGAASTQAPLPISDSAITVPAASEPSPETPLEPARSQASEPFQARPVQVPVLAPTPWPPGAPKPPPETAGPTTPAAPAVATSHEREDSTRRAPPVRLVGIEVANFIVESRAIAERDRLAATGLTVRVRTRWEAGTPIYRVVIGSYGSRREAERVADSLLTRGVVREARFMTLTKRN